MVHSASRVSRNPLASCLFEKSYTPEGSLWQHPDHWSHGLNPLLSPELKMQILITEMFDQLSDSVLYLGPEE